MIAMSGMCMHCACHPGGGMFARSVWLLMQMLMSVSVIHVVLVFRRRCIRIAFSRCYCGRALPSYMKVIGFGPGI